MPSLINYDVNKLDTYISNLSLLCLLSNLFSSSTTPMLYYRATEKIYCGAFGAEDLTRSDAPVDCIIGQTGIGIKTFLENNGHTFQKVQEFDKQRNCYDSISDLKKKVEKIAQLRNNALNTFRSLHNLTKSIYHCIVRSEGKIALHEEYMNYIDIQSIFDISLKGNTIFFSSISNGKTEEYSFSLTKSTLFKRFETKNDYFVVEPVKILDDPLNFLNQLPLQNIIDKQKLPPSIICPLYSITDTGPVVYPKSGLNQWNAAGRPRHPDEIYIPYNSQLRGKTEGFFPARDKPFKVRLPDHTIISMKVCQENCKAIMSNPNKDLGKWLLRDKLHIPQFELVSYSKLLEIGYDSVIFTKYDDIYTLDFCKVGEYERFVANDYKYTDREVLEDSPILD